MTKTLRRVGVGVGAWIMCVAVACGGEDDGATIPDVDAAFDAPSLDGATKPDATTSIDSSTSADAGSEKDATLAEASTLDASADTSDATLSADAFDGATNDAMNDATSDGPVDAGSEASADAASDAALDAGLDANDPFADAMYTTGRIPDSKDEVGRDPDGGNIPCPLDASAPGYGQDCTYHINVPTFTLYGGGVARDNITGLFWSQGAPDGGVTYDEAAQFCTDLNTQGLGGYHDWRLPTAREAVTLANSGQNGQGLDQAVFGSFSNAAIYTQTGFSAGVAWVLGGNYPVMFGYSKSTSFSGTHCVRGGTVPASTYAASLSGDSVTDLATGLEWQKLPPATGGDKKTWGAAIAYCENLTLDGHSDWRLPNYKELFSLVTFSGTSPAINAVFSNTVPDVYWSSTPVPIFAAAAYALNFSNGSAELTYPQGDAHYVRCTRGPE
jgi:hypothetical protein